MKALFETLKELLGLVSHYVKKKEKDRKADAVTGGFDAVGRAKRFLHKDGDKD